MPRSEINNPTHRILRILEEYQELEHCYKEVIDKVAHHAPALIEGLSPTPQGPHVQAEITRQGLMGRKVAYQRNYKRGVRAIAPEGTYPSSYKQAHALVDAQTHLEAPIQFTDEEMERIAQVIKEEKVAPSGKERSGNR